MAPFSEHHSVPKTTPIRVVSLRFRGSWPVANSCSFATVRGDPANRSGTQPCPRG